MTHKSRWLVALSVLASLVTMNSPIDAKPGGGGGGGGGSGSTIRVEDLGWPVGSLRSAASAINEAGDLVVGWAYWDVTVDYPNRNFAARWTRNAATGAWQAEDLRPLLPRHKTSEGRLVNDAGTVVVRAEITDSSELWFVIMSAGSTRELRPGDSVYDLNDADQMVGSGLDPDTGTGSPLYWASPSAAPVALPVIEDGYSGEAKWFQGPDILGTLADGSGTWLVRWSQADGAWHVARVQLMPEKYFLTGVGTSGRLALMHCAGTRYFTGLPIGCDWRATFWDPPYLGAPVYLPNVAGTFSWTGTVFDDGTVAGTTVASNGTDMLPVLWPTPTTLVKLPLLSGGKNAGAPGFNSHGQFAGYVDVPVKGLSRFHAVVWTLP